MILNKIVYSKFISIFGQCPGNKIVLCWWSTIIDGYALKLIQEFSEFIDINFLVFSKYTNIKM